MCITQCYPPSLHYLNSFKKYSNTTVKLKSLLPQITKSNKRNLQSLRTGILHYPNSRTEQIWLKTDFRNKRFRQQRKLDLYNCLLVKLLVKVLPTTRSTRSKKMSFVISHKHKWLQMAASPKARIRNRSPSPTTILTAPLQEVHVSEVKQSL